MGATIVAGAESLGKDLGLRKQHETSANVSRANSVRSNSQPPSVDRGNKLAKDEMKTEDENNKGVRPLGLEGEGDVICEQGELATAAEIERKADTNFGRAVESGVETLGHLIAGRTKTTSSQN